MEDLVIRFVDFFENYEELLMGGISVSAPFLDIFLKDEELAELLLDNNKEALHSAETALVLLGFPESKFKAVFS